MARVRIALYAARAARTRDALRAGRAAHARWPRRRARSSKRRRFCCRRRCCALLRDARCVIAYLGCGCGGGPSARSLPAAAATWLRLRPGRRGRALRRRAARRAFARMRGARRPGCTQRAGPARRTRRAASGGAARRRCDAGRCPLEPARLLADPRRARRRGARLLPRRRAGSAPSRSPARFAFTRRSPPRHFSASPASSICARFARPTHRHGHDALAYALLAPRIAIVAWRHGDALVHPALARPVAAAPASRCSARARIAAALRHRARRAGLHAGRRALGAPPPLYHATETTLADLFPANADVYRALAHGGASARALRDHLLPRRRGAGGRAPRSRAALSAGTWLRVDGRIDEAGGELRLAPSSVERVAPPLDPFVYR